MSTFAKPAFVYLVGASATGKTSLAEELVKRLDADLYTGAARGVIARWPLTPQEMLGGDEEKTGRDMAEYFKFQKAVLAEQKKLEDKASWGTADDRSAVLDRGIDHLAYMAHFCPARFLEWDDGVAACLNSFRYNLTTSLVAGLAVYLPPVVELIARARLERPANLRPFVHPATVHGVDAAIKGLLIPFAQTGRVLSLAGVTDLEERANAVVARLEALGFSRPLKQETGDA